MFILDSRETMPTPMMVNLKHEANDIGAEFDVDLFSGLPPPATAIAALPAGDDSEDDSGEEGAAGPVTPRVKAAEVSAAEVVQALVAPEEGEAAGSGEGRSSTGEWAAASADEESASEEVDSITSGMESDRDETPDVPAVDLA